MLRNTLTLFTALIISNTFACSCDQPDSITNQVFNEYQLIFKGEVLKVDTTNLKLIIHFKVSQSYHGKPDAIVKVSTYPGEAACGIFTKAKETWLIYAYSKGNKFETGLCTRSHNLLNPKSIVYDKKALKNDLIFLTKHLHNNNN